MHDPEMGANDLEGFVFPETLILSLLFMGSQSLDLAKQMLWKSKDLPGSLLACVHLFPVLDELQEAIELAVDVLQPEALSDGKG